MNWQDRLYDDLAEGSGGVRRLARKEKALRKKGDTKGAEAALSRRQLRYSQTHGVPGTKEKPHSQSQYAPDSEHYVAGASPRTPAKGYPTYTKQVGFEGGDATDGMKRMHRGAEESPRAGRGDSKSQRRAASRAEHGVETPRHAAHAEGEKAKTQAKTAKQRSIGVGTPQVGGELAGSKPVFRTSNTTSDEPGYRDGPQSPPAARLQARGRGRLAGKPKPTLGSRLKAAVGKVKTKLRLGREKREYVAHAKKHEIKDPATQAKIAAYRAGVFDHLRPGKERGNPQIKASTEYPGWQDKILAEMCQKCKDDGTEAAEAAPEGQKSVAYNKARREAENKRHGRPGETPRQTQVRRHGGGGMAARRSSGLGATTPRRRRRR